MSTPRIQSPVQFGGNSSRGNSPVVMFGERDDEQPTRPISLTEGMAEVAAAERAEDARKAGKQPGPEVQVRAYTVVDDHVWDALKAAEIKSIILGGHREIMEGEELTIVPHGQFHDDTRTDYDTETVKAITVGHYAAQDIDDERAQAVGYESEEAFCEAFQITDDADPLTVVKVLA